MVPAGQFTLVVLPHCEAISRDQWTEDHDDRPLSPAGREQAQALAAAIDADAIYTSPALRCRQTVEHLSERLGLPVLVLPELDEAGGFQEPAEWVDGVHAPIGPAVSGAWVAGRALGGLFRLAAAHPGGRVVACTHGDVIPVLLSSLAGAYAIPLPPLIEPGGWYRLRFSAGSLAVRAEHPIRAAADPVRTARLVLTPVGPGDVDDLTLLYGDPMVAYWTGPWTSAAVAEWAATMATRWATDGVGKWMARDRSDGSLVGRGGFTRIDLDGEAVLELGWVVRDARTGRGYATELGRAALAWAATHQPDLPIVAFTEVHNRASRAVMERLGMRSAGIIRRTGLVEGRTGLHPDAPFALYRL